MRSVGRWVIDTKLWDDFTTHIAGESGIHVDKLGTRRGQSGQFYSPTVPDFCSRGKTTTLRTFFTRLLRCVFHQNIQEYTSVLHHDFHILHMANNKYYKINLFINY